MSQFKNGTANAPKAMTRPDMLALARNIVRQTMNIKEYIEANNIPEPTFEPGSGSIPETSEYLSLHSSLKSSLEDLQRLVDGPRRFWRSVAAESTSLASIQVALDFGFFHLVPAEGEIALPELALKAGLDLDRVSRVVRAMITQGIFNEERDGFVSHNATSCFLREDQVLHCLVHGL